MDTLTIELLKIMAESTIGAGLKTAIKGIQEHRKNSKVSDYNSIKKKLILIQ
jgi:hypothetical protein